MDRWGNPSVALFFVWKHIVMSSDKGLATKIRQASHSAKQRLYYKLGIRKRGYSKKFIKNLERAQREAERQA
jgi:hypothetical protein